jgi:hypothetical protein
MKISTLAPSLFPDVLSHNGETYCALLEVGTGLVVMRWPDGYPENEAIVWLDPKAHTHGFARLTEFNGAVFVAYRRDDPAPEHVVAVDLMTGAVSTWSVPCVGMHPCCWGPGGMLAVIGFKDARPWVLVANWPDKPTLGPLSRDAFQQPTGLSRIVSGLVIFWSEEASEPLFQQRVWTPDQTGSTGITYDDRVGVDIAGERGQILAGAAYKAPRIAREASGAYTVASHREGPHGPTGVEVVTGITSADLTVPLEPDMPAVDAVPLVHGPFGFICYTFNDAPCLGNINLPIRPTQTTWTEPIVLPSDRRDLATGNQVWAVYAGENAGLTIEAAIVQARPLGNDLERGLDAYQDSFPTREQIRPLLIPQDVLTCLFKRGPNEGLAAFFQRSRDEVDRWDDKVAFWPTLHLGGETPKRAAETFIAFCTIAVDLMWPGFSLFAAGRADVPWHALQPYTQRFLSGITATPPARVLPIPPDPPEEPEDMNVYLLVTPAAPPAANKVPAPGDTKLLGARENLSDGGFAIKKPNGKYVALTPSKNWEERDSVAGDWEKFYDGKPGFILAPRRDDKCFTVEAVQGP